MNVEDLEDDLYGWETAPLSLWRSQNSQMAASVVVATQPFTTHVQIVFTVFDVHAELEAGTPPLPLPRRRNPAKAMPRT